MSWHTFGASLALAACVEPIPSERHCLLPWRLGASNENYINSSIGMAICLVSEGTSHHIKMMTFLVT